MNENLFLAIVHAERANWSAGRILRKRLDTGPGKGYTPPMTTKLDRILASRFGDTKYASHAERECYLCRGRIPAGARFMKCTIQARQYRSVRDMGCTTMEVRVCGKCLFPEVQR